MVCAVAFEPDEYDEETMYEKIVFGSRAESKDGTTAEVRCPKHYVMKQCECRDLEDCDGSWIRSNTKEDVCVVWTMKKDVIRGAVPKATCVRLWLTVESDVRKNPTASCPKDFNRVGCNLWSHYRVQKYPDIAVSQRDGACTTYGDCGDECRVQATCFRTGNV